MGLSNSRPLQLKKQQQWQIQVWLA